MKTLTQSINSIFEQHLSNESKCCPELEYILSLKPGSKYPRMCRSKQIVVRQRQLSLLGGLIAGDIIEMSNREGMMRKLLTKMGNPNDIQN